MPKNLFTANKFMFSLSGTRFIDNEFDLTITNISIPGIELGIIEQPSQIRTIKRPGDSLIFTDINMEFHITEDFTEWITIVDWMKALRDFREAGFDNDVLSDGKLVLLTNKNNPNIVMTFYGMFPISIAEIDLNLASTEGEPRKGQVTFSFNDFDYSTTT